MADSFVRDTNRLTDHGEKDAVLQRIISSTSLEDAAGVDFVIAAASENMAVKTDIFRKLDEVAPKEVILATNTSSLPITEVAAVTKRPQQVVGMHFMNPVPVMPLVEVIRGIATTDEVFRTVDGLARRLSGSCSAASRDWRAIPTCVR